MSKLSYYLLAGILFFWIVLLIRNGGAAETGGTDSAASAGSGTTQVQPPGIKQQEYGDILDRLREEKWKGFLASLKRINDGLRTGYAALVKNYAAYRVNYERTKHDTESRRPSPYYVLKNMQELEAAKEKLEADIKKLEKEKEALKVEALSFYEGRLPPGLISEWNNEEKAYTDYLNAVYRQVGWWMQIEYSPQWRKDESEFWDYIRQYYQQHPKEMDILK